MNTRISLLSLALVLALGAPVTAEPTPPEESARTGGGLTVHNPPRTPSNFYSKRLRTHTEGALSAGDKRVWVGPIVPAFIPLLSGTKELFLLDEDSTRRGWIALYRDPYGAGSCSLGTTVNCAYEIVRFDKTGEPAWRLDPAQYFSRPDYLEIQDLHYDAASGMLFFNEACQSYSSTVRGKCSALLAFDTGHGEPKLAWRTRNLTSNGGFALLERWIVTGYGFTNERDYVYLVDRQTGKVASKVKVKTAATKIRVRCKQIVDVKLYDDSSRTFAIKGIQGRKAKLVSLD